MSQEIVDHGRFSPAHTIRELKHQLPAQAPLKDFIHHNTLHAFQHEPFMDGIRHASQRFGYNVYLRLEDYRNEFSKGRIRTDVLEKLVNRRKGAQGSAWLKKILEFDAVNPELPKIGQLRAHWKMSYKVDLDAMVHPTLFRLLCSFLDQGISIWSFPVRGKGFWNLFVSLKKLVP